MKKNFYIIFTSLLLVVCFSINSLASQAGSQDDPIVTKSYVDKTVSEAIKSILSLDLNSDVSKIDKDDLDKITTEVLTYIYNNGMSNIASKSQIFKPLEVKAGRMLVGKEGTEIIQRSGKGAIYTNIDNGVVDVTSGIDLKNGEMVPNNHLLITPRDDGRGIICLGDSWFMVKGDFEIK